MSPVVLRGSLVTLRPFRQDELGRLHELMSSWPSDDGVHHTGAFDRDDVRRRIEASGSWSDGPVGLMLAIEAGGRLVGEIQARGNRSQLLPSGVFELGIELYDAGDRGHGLGSAAMTEISRYLFEEEGAQRVQLSTDVDNPAMRRASERAGFGFEGVLRGFMPTAGGQRDYAMYAMTRDDFEDVKGTWT